MRVHYGLQLLKRTSGLTDRELASMPIERGVGLWVSSNWGGGLIGLKLVF